MLLLRDVGQRLPLPGAGNRLAAALGALNERLGRTPLQALVKDMVRAVERHYIEAALDLTGDNRTAAAQLLGLSCQSLYAKLNRYGLDAGPAGVAASPRAKEEKIANDLVVCQDEPKGGQGCDMDVHFEPPDACQRVAGDIRPWGWGDVSATKA